MKNLYQKRQRIIGRLSFQAKTFFERSFGSEAFKKGVEEGYEDVHGPISKIPDHDGTEVMRLDKMLWDHQDHFKFRWNVFKNIRQAIDDNEKGMENFSQGAETSFFAFESAIVFRL